VDGTKFFVRAGETGLTQNIYTGLQDFEDMGFLLHFIRPSDLFVDVGANAGSYTILAGAARRATVYAIEPVPATFERLRKNISLNGLDTRVKCLNIGVGSERGTIRFTSGMDTVNHVLAKGEDEQNSIPVDVLPLDSVLIGETPALIKIDVEGYETPVIAGAKQVLQKESLKGVIMELNGSGARYGWDEANILQAMNDFGFATYRYDPFKRQLEKLRGKSTVSGNTLFLRDETFILERVKAAPLVTVLGNQF
jgi:FkbM family methyltransferase